MNSLPNAKSALDSFFLKRLDYNVSIKLYDDELVVLVCKDPILWYRGACKDLDEDGIQMGKKEIKEGKFEIIEKNGKLKMFIKGLPLILLEVDQTTPQYEKEIAVLKARIASLEETIVELQKKKDSNIANVTVHVDDVRKDYNTGDPQVVAFEVDKKFSDTILLIQGNICAHGICNAETTHFWEFGGKTISVGQTDDYNGSNYARSVTTFAVISGHSLTGRQELKLFWHKTMRPFIIINPNKTDHSQFFDAQTCSVYTVWEIFNK